MTTSNKALDTSLILLAALRSYAACEADVHMTDECDALLTTIGGGKPINYYAWEETDTHIPFPDLTDPKVIERLSAELGVGERIER